MRNDIMKMIRASLSIKTLGKIAARTLKCILVALAAAVLVFFAIAFFMGGYSCRLYEKKAGSKMLEFDTAGNRPVFEADNQLLIYSVDTGDDAFFPRSVYLYDLKNGKKHKLNTFLQKAQEKNLFWLNILNWFDSFEFGNITPENVEIVFYGCYKPLFDEAGENSSTQKTTVFLSLLNDEK